MTITSISAFRFLRFASWIQLIGARSASFLSVKGLKTLLNSDSVFDVEGVGPLDGDVVVDEAFVFPKKLAIIDRAFSCVSLSFLSFSALAAFFSFRSFSYKGIIQSAMALADMVRLTFAAFSIALAGSTAALGRPGLCGVI